EIRDNDNWKRLTACTPPSTSRWVGGSSGTPLETLRNKTFSDAVSTIHKESYRVYQPLKEQNPSLQAQRQYWAKNDQAALQIWLRQIIEKWRTQNSKKDESWMPELSDLLGIFEKDC